MNPHPNPTPLSRIATGLGVFICLMKVGLSQTQPPSPENPTKDELPRQITAKVLYVTDSVDPLKKSGAMDVILRISENPGNQPVVSCSIPTPGIRNDQWQASAWMAAFVASRRLDLQVSDYEFNVNATGVIDGPSAGMELTASLIALIKNVAIKPDRVMTGSVNPDGTIGPVGGIAAKLEAASRMQLTHPDGSTNVIKYVGIPVGQRLEFHKDENKFVDLIERARELKLTAIELKDVDDAYFFLTDQRLENSSMSAPVTTPQISLAAINRLRTVQVSMQENFRDSQKKLSEICEGRFPDRNTRDPDGQFLIGQLDLSAEYNRRSLSAINGGAPIAGYYHLLKAATHADIGRNYDRILGPNSKSKSSEREAQILSAVANIIGLRTEVAKAREALALAIKDNIDSKRLATKLEAINAQLSLREAYSYETSADDLILTALSRIMNSESSPESKARAVAPDFFPTAQQACTYYALARTRYTAAKDWYTFSLARDMEHDLVVKCGLPFFENLGTAFSKGAQSALAYLDATLKQGWQSYLEGEDPLIKFEGSQYPFQIRGARNEALPIKIAMAGNIPFNDANFPRIASLIEGRYLPARKAAFSESSLAVSDGDAAGPSSRAHKTEDKGSALATLLREKWVSSNPKTGDLDAFGSGASAFLSLSSLVMKYYNYQGDDERMMNSRSIGIYIDLARSKALMRAGLLGDRMFSKLRSEKKGQRELASLGETHDYLLPEAITVNLELADILRYGGPDDKVISLMTFWRAHMLADIALAMITYSEKNTQ